MIRKNCENTKYNFIIYYLLILIEYFSTFFNYFKIIYLCYTVLIKSIKILLIIYTLVES